MCCVCYPTLLRDWIRFVALVLVVSVCVCMCVCLQQLILNFVLVIFWMMIMKTSHIQLHERTHTYSYGIGANTYILTESWKCEMWKSICVCVRVCGVLIGVLVDFTILLKHCHFTRLFAKSVNEWTCRHKDEVLLCVRIEMFSSLDMNLSHTVSSKPRLIFWFHVIKL